MTVIEAGKLTVDQAYQMMLHSCSTSLVLDFIRFGRLYHKLPRLQDSI